MKRHKKITRTPGEWVLDIVKVVFHFFPLGNASAFS